jgi:hypothetical protein
VYLWKVYENRILAQAFAGMHMKKAAAHLSVDSSLLL